MTVRFKHQPRLGKFQCEGCNLRFELQPGGHDKSRCPRCNSLYYTWLDYLTFVPLDTQKNRVQDVPCDGLLDTLTVSP